MKAATTVCSNCNSDDCWILHHVHHRNTYRRLCTSCVLKLNITSFCPICFSLHDRPKKSALPPLVPAIRGTLVCFKCNSSSHPSCVAPNTPKSPYLCPTCTNPHAKLFDFRKSGIDLKASKVLLAAAMIAANSLNEAVEQARFQAERKAKEAVAARKRAKDALERVALVWMRDQERTPNNLVPVLDNINSKTDKGSLSNGVQLDNIDNHINVNKMDNLGREDDNVPT